MFASSNNSEIMQSIDKNLTFKTKDYSGSDKDKKEKRSSDSSSFIKQSSELRLVYDKTVLSS